MDDTLELRPGSVSLENLVQNGEPPVVGRKQNLSSSSTSLSDSGCPKSPDDADFVFSPPTMSRCVTDSPSHYFLRGNHHRWASTPLLKVGGFPRSMSIPVSTTPSVPTHFALSPPQASSTPEASENQAKDGHLEDSSSMAEFSSLCSDANFTPSSLSKIVVSPPITKMSSLAQLSSAEFHQRIETYDIQSPELELQVATISEKQEQEKVKTLNKYQKSQEGSPQEDSAKLGYDSDSGIGSSQYETSTEESPKREKTRASTIIPKLRRSPRSLAIQSRLDRCMRVKQQTSPRNKGKLKTVSSYIVPHGIYLEREYLDILMHLRINMPKIVDMILGYLAPEDLCSVSLVNTSWHSLMKDDLMKIHEARRKAFVTAKKLNQENYGRPVHLTRSSSRIALKEMSKNVSPQNKRNRDCSSSAPSVISPSKIRSRLFPENNDRPEKLLHCPNCSATSTVNITKDKSGCDYERGECTSKSCSMIFCAKCMFSDHPGKPCQYLQLTRSRAAAVTSKKSKARLRRL